MARTSRSDAPIIVGGCPRSGTTLLRLILDSHPRIACGPELKMLQPIAESFRATQRDWAAYLEHNFHVTESILAQAFGAQARALLEPYRQRQGKPRLAEKTPTNIFVFPALALMFPDSPLVAVIRDGRDVVASLLRQNWVNLLTGEPMAYTRDAAKAAELWVTSVRCGRSLPDAVAEQRYYELFYERLIDDPESELRKLFAFLGEEWDEAVLRFHEQHHRVPQGERQSHGSKLEHPINPSSRGRWRADLSQADQQKVKQVAGATLMQLGYCEDLDW